MLAHIHSRNEDTMHPMSCTSRLVAALDSLVTKQIQSCLEASFYLARGGGSSGRTSDYGSKGPEFNCHWKLGFFHFTFLYLNHCVLNQVPRGGATLLFFQLSHHKMEVSLSSLRQRKLNMNWMSKKALFYIFRFRRPTTLVCASSRNSRLRSSRTFLTSWCPRPSRSLPPGWTSSLLRIRNRPKRNRIKKRIENRMLRNPSHVESRSAPRASPSPTWLTSPTRRAWPWRRGRCSRPRTIPCSTRRLPVRPASPERRIGSCRRRRTARTRCSCRRRRRPRRRQRWCWTWRGSVARRKLSAVATTTIRILKSNSRDQKKSFDKIRFVLGLLTP